jgi:transcriptional regulator with XRE-family HTH domain
VGRRVRTGRLERGLTQEQLAVAAGVSQQYLSDLERGKRNPTVLILFDIGQALGLPAYKLLIPDGG